MQVRGSLAVRFARSPLARPRSLARHFTVRITGRVRNAAGDVRTVKLPVRLPR